MGRPRKQRARASRRHGELGLAVVAGRSRRRTLAWLVTRTDLQGRRSGAAAALPCVIRATSRPSRCAGLRHAECSTRARAAGRGAATRISASMRLSSATLSTYPTFLLAASFRTLDRCSGGGPRPRHRACRRSGDDATAAPPPGGEGALLVALHAVHFGDGAHAVRAMTREIYLQYGRV